MLHECGVQVVDEIASEAAELDVRVVAEGADL